MQFVSLADGKQLFLFDSRQAADSLVADPLVADLRLDNASYSWGGARFLATPSGTLFPLIAIHLHD